MSSSTSRDSTEDRLAPPRRQTADDDPSCHSPAACRLQREERGDGRRLLRVPAAGVFGTTNQLGCQRVSSVNSSQSNRNPPNLGVRMPPGGACASYLSAWKKSAEDLPSYEQRCEQISNSIRYACVLCHANAPAHAPGRCSTPQLAMLAASTLCASCTRPVRA